MKADASSAMVDLEYAGDGNFERIAYDNQSFTDSILGTSTRTGGTTPDQSYIRDNTGRLIAVREGTARRYVHADALVYTDSVANQLVECALRVRPVEGRDAAVAHTQH
jgi:hypothetical protein